MTQAEFNSKLKVFEGYAEHMYLDSKGKVTIGTGIHLQTEQEAKKIAFFHKITGKVATAEEISKEYGDLKKMLLGQPSPYYSGKTSLKARASDLNAEFERRLKIAKEDAKAYYPDFDKLPTDVQFALIDMSFNLGKPKLLIFWDLKKALMASDWEKAAKESNRVGPSKSRNDAIKEWIRSAKTTSSNKLNL